MGKLIDFFRKNSVEVLFFCLMLVAFTIMVQNQHFHRTTWFFALENTSKKMKKWMSAKTDYLSLRSQNELLQQENARLRSLYKQNYYLEQFPDFEVSDSLLKQQYTYVPARAVDRSFRKRNNYMLLDVGENHGIENGMGVISPAGVVGVIRDVSPHFSKVVSLLHKDFRLSCSFKKNKHFGSLVWRGEDYRYAYLTDLPTHTPIETGDTIVTDSKSLIFPEGIMVGVIKSFKHIEEYDLVEAKIELSTDFSAIRTVYVVRDIFKKEYEQFNGMSNNE